MTRRISVAFVNMVNPAWMAGGQYLYNLLYAIKAAGVNIETVLKVSKGTPVESYGMLDGLVDRVMESPRALSGWVFKLPLQIRKRVASWILLEDHELRKQKIDAQFLLVDPGTATHTPSFTWIPDFQHLHFPEFFTREELNTRMQNYREAALKSKVIILSSNAALKDIQQIVPEAVNKARILSFVAQVDQSAYDNEPLRVANDYHLPFKFFFLPNQFWRHKNHRVVLAALKIACEEFPYITVVCSGGTYDHRDPEYFDVILKEIATLGLQENFRVLGRIPRSDLYALMRQSLAVLQPSLFEGWSTSVEEVKSLGKKIVLSDIPVHREQNPSAAYYFNPQDAQELARILQTLFTETAAGPDLELEVQSRSELPERTRVFAATFYKIIYDLFE